MNPSNHSYADMQQLMDESENRLENLLDCLHLADSTKETANANDAVTVDETISETASEISSCKSCDESVDEGNDSNDDEISSTHSDHSNTSTRQLLKQAKLRLHHQSICEEVDVLRAEVVQYKHSLESALRQKLQVKDRCNTLESQLTQAMETILSYKRKEQKWNDEVSQREKDFMNHINDLCSDTKVKEQYLMGEIVERDKKIIELQNLLNANNDRLNDVSTSTTNIEKQGVVVVVTIESEERMIEMDMDDDSWSDDSSCHFI